MSSALARCFPESNPLAENVMIELGLWNVPEEIRGKVESLEEMTQKVFAHSRFSSRKDELEVYLRQHRQKRVCVIPFLVRHLKKGGEEIKPTDDGFSKGYDIYSLRGKAGAHNYLLNVGYGCGECGALMIGHPVNSSNLSNITSNIIYYCENCGIEIDSFDLKGRGKSWLERMHEGIGLHLNSSPLTR
jgi:hypothetical protein